MADFLKMSFSQKEYTFSHTMAKVSRAHQPALFKIDLRDLVPVCGELSPLFVMGNMSVTAYKQGTLEKIPIRFTVLGDNTRSVLTNDPCKLSSKWDIELNGGSRVKIAGTDTVPFKCTIAIHEEENRQALVNALAFMMLNSLWVSDRARGTFGIVAESVRGEFHFKCKLCPDRQASFLFSQCADGYVCIPSPEPCADDKDYNALRNLTAL